MYTLNAKNVHCAMPWVGKLLKDEGYERGDVVRLPMPLCVLLARPTERCVAWAQETNANVFDRFFAPLGAIRQYSKALRAIAKALREDVMGIPQVLPVGSAQVTFQRGDEGELCCMVCGCAPDPITDAAVFGAVVEFTARLADLSVGGLWLTSMNVNVKKSHMGQLETLAERVDSLDDPYVDGKTSTHALMSIQANRWTRELETFVDSETKETQIYADTFFSMVAVPMFEAGKAMLEGRFAAARAKLDECVATDWRTEAHAFVNRVQGERIILP